MTTKDEWPGSSGVTDNVVPDHHDVLMARVARRMAQAMETQEFADLRSLQEGLNRPVRARRSWWRRWLHKGASA